MSFLIAAMASLVAIAVVAILIGFFVWKRRGIPRKQETDYRAFYIMGWSFLPLGLIMSVTVSPGFMGITALGIIYMAIGAKNKDKWRENVDKRKKKSKG